MSLAQKRFQESSKLHPNWQSIRFNLYWKQLMLHFAKALGKDDD